MGIGAGAAILIGTAVSAGVGIYGAKKVSEAQQEATEAAARTAESTTDKATAAQMKMFETSREDIAPWRQAGETALEKLLGKISAFGGGYTGVTREGGRAFLDAGPPDMQVPGVEDFEESPSYNFLLKEGVKALDRSASARGRLRSGAQEKAITRFGQDYALRDYENFLDRFFKKAGFERQKYFDELNPLLSIAGMGQVSAGQAAGQATQTGQGISDVIMAGGQNVAQGQFAGGKARASGYTNLANVLSGAATSGVENFLTLEQLRKYNPSNVPWSSYPKN